MSVDKGSIVPCNTPIWPQTGQVFFWLFLNVSLQPFPVIGDARSWCSALTLKAVIWFSEIRHCHLNRMSINLIALRLIHALQLINQPINTSRQRININRWLNSLTVHRVIKPDDLTILSIPVLQGHAWFILAEVNVEERWCAGIDHGCFLKWRKPLSYRQRNLFCIYTSGRWIWNV